MNEVKIFENEEFGKVRTLIEGEDKVLFCGTDVAQATKRGIWRTE